MRNRSWGVRMLLIGMMLVGASLAFGDGTVVIYNAGSPEMGEDLAKAFRARHPDI